MIMQRVFLLGYNPLLQDISGVILREHFSLYIELRHQYSNNVLKHQSFPHEIKKCYARGGVVPGKKSDIAWGYIVKVLK